MWLRTERRCLRVVVLEVHVGAAEGERAMMGIMMDADGLCVGPSNNNSLENDVVQIFASGCGIIYDLPGMGFRWPMLGQHTLLQLNK